MAKIDKNYSPNFSIPKRSKKKIQFIILHYTGMKTETSVLRKIFDQNSKVSAHYFVKRNGEIVNFVPDLYEAWHAGKSKWKRIKSLNKYSIGIEIQNTGHDFKYEKFSPKQISSLKNLLRKLIKKYQIKLENILGHSDVSPDRKKDPGEKFPWKKLANSKLAIWHKLNKKKIKRFRYKKIVKKEEIVFFKNLSKIGYKGIKRLNSNLNKKNLIKAFQRRFRQDLINGKIDKECFLISKNLVN